MLLSYFRGRSSRQLNVSVTTKKQPIQKLLEQFRFFLAYFLMYSHMKEIRSCDLIFIEAVNKGKIFLSKEIVSVSLVLSLERNSFMV